MVTDGIALSKEVHSLDLRHVVTNMRCISLLPAWWTHAASGAAKSNTPQQLVKR